MCKEITLEDWSRVQAANALLGPELNARVAHGHEVMLLKELEKAGFNIPRDWRKSRRKEPEATPVTAYNILEEALGIVEAAT